jgi:hypothetical protein
MSHIVLIAMDNKQAIAARGGVNAVPRDFDAAKVHAAIDTERFVVIAWDENNTRSLAGFIQKRLENLMMRCRPDDLPAKTPKIDDIADEIDRFRFVRAQKLKQCHRLRGCCPKVDVRKEKRAVTPLDPRAVFDRRNEPVQCDPLSVYRRAKESRVTVL